MLTEFSCVVRITRPKDSQKYESKRRDSEEVPLGRSDDPVSGDNRQRPSLSVKRVRESSLHLVCR